MAENQPMTPDDQALLERLVKPSSAEDMVAVRACVCGKEVPLADLERKFYSGVVNYKERLCQDCRTNYEKFARIVCIGCNHLTGFIPPGTKHASGFRFETNGHYHTQSCPRCKPDNHATPILELIRFMREQGIPINTDKDIVQEAEQKALQGEREAESIRKSLNGDSTA